MPQKKTDKNLILPDSVFFMKILDADSSLSDADCRAIAQNFLEGDSPLPVEQLLWSAARNKNRLLVCAASAERLYSSDTLAESLGVARRAFPAFAAVFSGNFKDGKYSYVLSGSKTFFKVQNGCATDVFSVSADETPKEDCSDEGYRPICVEISESATSLKFSARTAEGSEIPAKWKIRNSRMRNLCDVRSAAQLKEISKNVFKGALVQMFFAAAALSFAGLCVWQVSSFANRAKLSSLQSRLAEISPKAKAVEAMSEQLAFLNSFSKKPLGNARLVAIANKARSADIEFSKTSASSADTLQIFGKAESAGSVNRFEEALKRDVLIKSVSTSVPNSKSGNAQFEITITFK